MDFTLYLSSDLKTLRDYRQSRTLHTGGGDDRSAASANPACLIHVLDQGYASPTQIQSMALSVSLSTLEEQFSNPKMYRDTGYCTKTFSKKFPAVAVPDLRDGKSYLSRTLFRPVHAFCPCSINAIYWKRCNGLRTTWPES